MAPSSRTYLRFSINFFLLFTCINCLRNKNNLQQFISTEKMEAENYSFSTRVTIYNDCTNKSVYYVGAPYTTSTLEYDHVDFGSGVSRVALYASNSYSGVNDHIDAYLRLGSATAAPFAIASVPATGSDVCSFTIVDTIIDPPISGIQDLFITFPSGNLNVDWLVFNQTLRVFEATEVTEAEDYTSAENIRVFDDCTNLTYVQPSSDAASVLEFDLVDFGSGAELVTLRVANTNPGPPVSVLLHLGSPTSTPIANVRVGPTGTGSCDFVILNAFLETFPAGTQNLFLTFPATTSGEEGYLRVDWLKFNSTFKAI